MTKCLRCKTEIKEYGIVIVTKVMRNGGRVEQSYAILECPNAQCGHVELVPRTSATLKDLVRTTKPVEP